ncbi:hypothetical protein GZL_06961 [Streptomyces sp. 769]|nr:hypothetical protein GZL_06961 [Streptomyces sp. 769]
MWVVEVPGRGAALRWRAAVFAGACAARSSGRTWL